MQLAYCALSVRESHRDKEEGKRRGCLAMTASQRRCTDVADLLMPWADSFGSDADSMPDLLCHYPSTPSSEVEDDVLGQTPWWMLLRGDP